MPKYTIKKGYENRVFSEQGVRRISETEIESDHELFSPILTLVQDTPTANPAPAAVSQPVQAAAPAPAAAPAAQPQTQTINKESEN